MGKSQQATAMRFWRWLSYGLLIVLGVVWTQLPLGTEGIPIEDTADSTADWIVTRAAVDGLDPYSDIRDLSDELSVPYVILDEVGGLASLLPEPPYVHPRLPGAIVLQTPMLLGTPLQVLTVVNLLSIAALVIVLFAIYQMTNADPRVVAVAIPFVFLRGIVSGGLAFGVQSMIVAALVAAAWLIMRRRDGIVSGVLIGLAATLKVFPLILVLVAIRYRRFRTAGTAVGLFVALNLTGMLVFGLGPGKVLNGFSESARVWLPFGANGSLAALVNDLGLGVSPAGMLSVVVSFLAVWVFLKPPVALDIAVAVSLVIGVLGSPLAWGHYDIILVPAAAVLWRAGPLISRVFVSIWAAVVFVFGRFIEVEDPAAQADIVGYMLITTRLLLLAAGVVAMVRASRTLAPGTEMGGGPVHVS